MGGVFENLGTTNKLSEPTKLSFEPAKVLLGPFCFLTRFLSCMVATMLKGLSVTVKCDLSKG